MSRLNCIALHRWLLEFNPFKPNIISHPYQMDKVSKKAKIRNQYNQVPHSTKDTTWERDEIKRKHHIQESLDVTPSPQQATTRPQ